MARKHLSTGSPFEEALSYSRAVVQGDWCFMAGVTGYDYDRMVMPEDIAAQVTQSFETITKVLGEAGFKPQDIVRVTHYIADRSLVDAASPAIGNALKDIRPAATMVLAELMEPNMLYEVEVTAYKGG
ncbi:MAG: RidA family protein [Dinoroseobacter sp.]|nr:RidA family protein [Dinoroseobacter sp.]